MLPDCPDELKHILPYLQRASELKGREPLIAYYCKVPIFLHFNRAGELKHQIAPLDTIAQCIGVIHCAQDMMQSEGLHGAEEDGCKGFGGAHFLFGGVQVVVATKGSAKDSREIVDHAE